MEIKDNCNVFDIVTNQSPDTIPIVRFSQAAFNKNFHHNLCWARYYLDLVFQKQSEGATPEKILLAHGRIIGSRYNKCKRKLCQNNGARQHM